MEKLRAMREAASGILLTFHRAFDLSPDPAAALQAILECGCDRLLTSGQQPSALKGIPLLSHLVQSTAGRIAIVAAAGIDSFNVGVIIAGTGVLGVHAGSSVMSPRYNEEVALAQSRYGKGATMGTGSSTTPDSDMKWMAADRTKVEKYSAEARAGFHTFRKNAERPLVAASSVELPEPLLYTSYF